MKIVPGFVALILLLYSIAPVAKGSDDERSIVKCQKALLAGKVANGEFNEETLEKAIGLPADQLRGEQESEIKKLFLKLGAGKFEDRRAASRELMSNFNSPATLRALLKETDDPEIKERAEEVLTSWKVIKPNQDFLVRFKMWLNAPCCMAKMKFAREMYENASKAGKLQLYCDTVMAFGLDDFPADQRIKAVVSWMNLCIEKWGIASFSFFTQLKKEEWRDKELLDAVKKALVDQDSMFCSSDFESLLWNIPADIDLKGWLPMLDSAGKRKGALAALLVKTGVTEAMPAFVDVLNQEWSSCSIDKGRINGGGHSGYFSPFNRFEILGIPEYRKYAAEILKGIENKFNDDRVAFHDSYLNAVRFFADTDAGRALLTTLSTNRHAQTAIAAILMLDSKTSNKESLQRLSGLLDKAQPDETMNNFWQLKSLLQKMCGKIHADPDGADEYRKFVRVVGERMIRNALASKPDYLQKDLLDFFMDELAPYDLVSVDRKTLVDALSERRQFGTWEYAESPIHFLVMDAKKKGDTREFLDELAARATAKDSRPGDVVLYAGAILWSGETNRLDGMEDKFREMLGIVEGNRCAPIVREASWVRFPQMLIESKQPMEWSPNYLVVGSKFVAPAKMAAKLSLQHDKPYLSQLFGMSYDVQGASLHNFKEVEESNAIEAFSEMAWKNPPAKDALAEKIAGLCRELKSRQNAYRCCSFVDFIPGMTGRFGVGFSKVGKPDFVLQHLISEISFRNGDRKGFEEAVAKMTRDPEFSKTAYISTAISMRRIIVDLSGGRVNDDLKAMFADPKKKDASTEIYELVHILYEGGFPEKARELRRMLVEPDMFRLPDYAECCLPWAWNEMIAGNKDEALKLVEINLLNAGCCREQIGYAKMMMRLLKENSAEFREFLRILSMKQDFSKRTEYAEALSAFAGKAGDKDLKALSSFMAGRLMLVLGKGEGPVGRLWKMGADSGGFHSGYCGDAINSVPERLMEFMVTSSWYSREKMPNEMTPFTYYFGVYFKGEKPYLAVDSSEWIGPYGIPVSRNVMQFFIDGSGYWYPMRGQARSWVPGEWSIIVKYKDGVEYHQRSLLPYGKVK